MKKVLDLGCGDYKVSKEWLDAQLKEKSEYEIVGTGLDTDIDLDARIDVKHDLDKFPYPFKDNEFDVVVALNILEHLWNLEGVIKELHRIIKDGGKLIVVVPHWSSIGTWSTIQHKRGFSTFLFLYDIKNYGFEPKDVRIRYLAESREGRVGYRKKNVLTRFFASVLDFLANSNLYLFERFWRNAFGGFNEIYAVEEVVKNGKASAPSSPE